MGTVTHIIPLGAETSGDEALRLASMLGMWLIEKGEQKRLASERVPGWRCTKNAMSTGCLNHLLGGDAA